MNRAARFAYLLNICESHRSIVETLDSPPDLIQWNIIKTVNYILLHLVNLCCARACPVAELYCTPVLLYKVKLTVVFRVEVTDMASRSDILLKPGFLGDEVGLVEEKPSAAAIGTSILTLKLVTLCIESFSWPETMFSNDSLHSFKPAWHCRMVIGIAKQLRLSICQDPIAHFWPTGMMCPAFIWVLWHFVC